MFLYAINGVKRSKETQELKVIIAQIRFCLTFLFVSFLLLSSDILNLKIVREKAKASFTI